MTKSLSKGIMLCSRLKTFLRPKTEESKQRNLSRKAKRNYFADLDNRILKNDREFLKTVNPMFSEKKHAKKTPLQ